MSPLAIDLFCGLGGWTEGLLAEGYRVVGFDNERHEYGEAKYPGQLVIQDVLTLHGSQFKDAALIVASPPCQEYSYMAMPWTRARAIAAEYRSGARDVSKLTALFDACFRIQREASEAAGRHIPLIVENVKGAQPWVGRAGWHFGSYYLWGDIPALMPIARAFKNPGFRFDGSGKSFQSESVNRMGDGAKSVGMNWSDRTKHGQDFTRIAGEQARLREEAGVKVGDRNKARANGGHKWTADFNETIKGRGGSWFGNYAEQKAEGRGGSQRQTSSNSKARKAASAAIAKIPFVLAQHIARAWKPEGVQV